MFESVDAPTDRHCLQSHPISSPEAFGACELNINKLLLDRLGCALYKNLKFLSFAPIQNHSYSFWHRAIYTSNNETN